MNVPSPAHQPTNHLVTMDLPVIVEENDEGENDAMTCYSTGTTVKAGINTHYPDFQRKHEVNSTITDRRPLSVNEFGQMFTKKRRVGVRPHREK